ncbi:hypothetical protein F7725_004347, partial [Dissostichus mawsoni]
REGESSDKQQQCSQSGAAFTGSSSYCGLSEQKAARTFPLSFPAFCRVSFIHSLLNAIAEVRSLLTRHKAWAVWTSSGQSGEGAPRRDGSRSSSPPAGRPGSRVRRASITRDPQVNGDGGGANPQRLGQRAPKLGQIGRTKKVDMDDEDLDDIMNNNSQCPVSPIS